MSFLRLHHIILQQFRGHAALEGFDLDARNLIYLPAKSQLAASMGVSPHSGGHLNSYIKGVSRALDDLMVKETDPVARLAAVGKLVDTMRVALANGNLYSNQTDGIDANAGNKIFFDNWRGYFDEPGRPERKDQLAANRALEQRGDLSQQPHLIKWSAIIDNDRREELINDAIKKRRGENITAGSRDLRGTPFAKFAAADPLPDLPPSMPPRPIDLPPLPGYLRQTDTFGLPGFSVSGAVPPLPGFTPSNPFLQLPGFTPSQEFAGPQTLIRSLATLNRAAQLAGLPNGGISLGKQTAFPSPLRAWTRTVAPPHKTLLSVHSIR